jgi:hypothetical protein
MKWIAYICLIVFSTGCDLVPSSYFKIEGAGGESAVKIVLTEGTETVVQGESFTIQVEIQNRERSLRVIQGPNSQSVLEARLATGKGDVIGTKLIKAVSGVARFEELSFDEAGEKVLEIRLADDPEVAVKTQPLQVVSPKAELSSLPVSPNNLSEVSITVNGVGVDQYRYKFGLKDSTDCSLDSGYSGEYLASKTLDLDVSALVDGEIKLCVIGGTLKGYWQELNEATTATWIKDTQAFTATLSGVPSGLSDNVVLDISVAGEGVVFYKYKLGVATTTDCSVMSGYSSQRMVSQKIIDDIASLADRKLRLCVIGGSSLGNWQQVATSAEWYKQVFKPADLNINGRIGMDFNPTDLSTMFKDPFGLEPVTAPGDSVGLILDTFQGDLSNLGAERLGNGTFDTNLSGWIVKSNISATWENGEAVLTGAGGLNMTQHNWFEGPQVLTEGHCLVEFDATWISGGSLFSGPGYNARITITAASNGGVKTRYRYITPQGTSGSDDYFRRLNFGAAAGAVWRIDNVSVKEIPGHHLYQNTSSRRPILARMPDVGRRNLLNNSLAISNWTKAATGTASVPVVTDQVALAPDGTTSASEVYLDRGAGNSGSDHSYLSFILSNFEVDTYMGSVWIKAASTSEVGKQLAFRHVAGGSGYKIVTLTENWVRHSKIESFATSSTRYFQIANRGTYTDSSQVNFHLWAPQLERGTELTSYQKVRNTHDVVEDGRRDLWYLHFDGSNDFLLSTPVDMTSSSKASTFVGAKKMHDAADVESLFEFSTNFEANANSFNLTLNQPGGIRYASYSRGTTGTVDVSQRGEVHVGEAVERVVLSAFHSIADSLTKIWRNGTIGQDGTGAKGTGALGHYPLYVGMRGGADRAYKGRIYKLSIIADELTENEFLQMQNLMAAFTNVELSEE